MATIGNSVLTLADWSKRLDPDGKVPTIVELLSETNEILEDMMWLEGNLPTGHRTTVRTGLPDVAWRMLNYGIQPSKSTTVQVDDSCGMLEAFSEVDIDLAKLNGNVESFRLSEARAFVESMNQNMAETLFYGDTGVFPERFLGLAPRYGDLGSDNAQNIIDGGGTGTDNTSIWLVCWGAGSVHGIFPKGSTAGLIHEDLGIETVEDANGGRFRAFQDRFQWKCGMSLRDWRYVVRIPNIDVSDLGTPAGADLIELMIKAMHRLPNMNAGRCVFYANRTICQALDIQARNTSNLYLTQGNEESGPKTTFRGVPIRKCDAIAEDEDQVV